MRKLTGTFSGQLTDSQGKIESEENWVCTIFSDCDLWNVCTTDEPFYREFDIQITGGNMTGTAIHHTEDTERNLDWIFNVIKR